MPLRQNVQFPIAMVKSAHMKSADEYFLIMGHPWVLKHTRSEPEPQPDHSQSDADWCGSSRQEAVFTINQGSVIGDKSILCISM
jgi:hypothetical protein